MLINSKLGETQLDRLNSKLRPARGRVRMQVELTDETESVSLFEPVAVPAEIWFVADVVERDPLIELAAKRLSAQLVLSFVDGASALMGELKADGSAHRRPDVIVFHSTYSSEPTISELQGDADLRPIPVVVLTNSLPEVDAISSYGINALWCEPKPPTMHCTTKFLRRLVAGVSNPKVVSSPTSEPFR